MDDHLRAKILGLLDAHRIMSLATLRPDGWPQATTVGFVSDGLTLYFLCDPSSQKAANLARDDRVSLTIDHDVTSPLAITGLSMAAHARPVDSLDEIRDVVRRLREKYPEYVNFPMPPVEAIRIFRVTSVVISVLDYTQGFGHIDQIVL